MASIAFIGLGNMGRPMAANLVKAGHEVRGYDVVADAVTAAAADGIEPAGSIAEAIDGAEAAITMVQQGDHARAAYLGPDGVFALAATGTLLIDSSTIDVATAQLLHDEASRHGFGFVDAPVSGGIGGAVAGSLTFMVGGDPDVVEQARSVLGPMAGNVIATGGPTSGQAAKICNNLMLFVNLQGMVEAAALARGLGLDATVFHDIATVSSGNSWALQTWYPIPGVVETAAANREFAASFRTDLAAKDIGLALAGAEQLGLDLPASRLVAEQFERVVAEGDGDRDCSIIVRNIDPESPGLPPAPTHQERGRQ